MLTVDSVHDLEREISRLTVSGHLTADRRDYLRTCLSKALAACPRAVIVDLRDFDDVSGTAAALFVAAQVTARQDYGVALLWVMPARGALRTRLDVPHWRRALRLHDRLDQAVAALDAGPPAPEQFRVVLRPDALAVSRARALVHEACVSRGVPQLAATACRIVVELALNAVVHAGTECTVTAGRRGAYLWISVRDGDPAPPRLPAGRPTGLHLLERRAAAWGWLRGAAGKTVWAAVRLPA
ncbi:ATP-binding protein [Dactylosporangium aurantiacum]|uniref:ATP-binding protein n=1 Tax=Dactylosporangium aurantiacum TaxID=35754 RepID=A0A9Q9IU03_9ACTN|nr:ATP-binding protein [Dactylosporangium aurantiacum]MDG6103854.1 ATP-binding protein [Dactylosporangium aurantiacum]UWZ58948.1 ATP-binding protein [Dactylosporangium aurantiacum]